MIWILRLPVAGDILVPALDCPKISEFTIVTFCYVQDRYFNTYLVCLKGIAVILIFFSDLCS